MASGGRISKTMTPINMKVSMNRIRKTERGFLNGKVETSTLETIGMMREMAQER